MISGLLTDDQRLSDDQQLTDDILSTLFCDIECIVNSRPLTKVSDDPLDDAAVTRSTPSASLGNFNMLQKCWRYNQHLVESFWGRYIREFIPHLQKRNQGEDLIESWRSCHHCWWEFPGRQCPIALIIEVNHSRYGLVRSVILKSEGSEITRPITKVVPLECDIILMIISMII